MSLGHDGKRIVCNGKSCSAVAAIPVALRPILLVPGTPSHSAEGWLFISKRDASLHFCPACARSYLEEHRQDNNLKRCDSK